MAQPNQLMPGEWELQDLGSFANQYKQDKENIYLKEAIAMGNMDPRAAEGYYKGKLDRAITNGITSLFGGQAADPELRKANDLDAIFKSLSDEDIKDPAAALNKIADELAAKGHTKEAISYRLKAQAVAQDTITKSNKGRLDTLNQNIASAKYIGSQANGTLEAFKTISKDRPELKKQFWDNYVAKYEQVMGKEEADKLRKLPDTAWEAQLNSDINGAESAATTSMEQRQLKTIEASKDNAVIKAAAVVEGAGIRAKAQMAKLDKELGFKYSNLAFRKTVAARKDIEARVKAGDDQVKQLSDDIEQIDRSLDNFRTKINFAGEDKETVQANINILESKKATIMATKSEIENQNSTFRQQFNDVIATNTQAYNPAGTSPTTQPTGISSNYDRYLKEFKALNGNPAKQKALTDWARSNGIVK
jgi:hypothetical protein